MIRNGKITINRLDAETRKNARFKVSDGEIDYDQLQAMFPMTEKRANNDIFLFFDDCVTFTSLGFLDFMNKTVFKKEDFNFYVDSFFKRNNKYLDGMEFAQVILRENTGYNFAVDDLKQTLKENYGKILQHSPSSGIILSLSGGGKSISNLYIIFKYEFDYADILIQSIKDELFRLYETNIHYLFLDKESDTDLILKYKPNIIFGGNTAVYYDLMIEHQIPSVEFFTNVAHNGFCEEFLDKWFQGPVNSNILGHKLYFYEDQLINHEPEEEEDDEDGHYNEYFEEEEE